MREVFRPAETGPDPVHGVFYTVTEQDVGKSTVIRTTAGYIPVGEVLGRVLRGDVGKRIYAVLSDDGTCTVWQAENEEQRLRRLGWRRGE